MSNDPQPTKPGVINGQISQIPGLSTTTDSLSDDRARGRRVGVLESDSDYVKLAKQGGHKGLLWHEENIDDEAVTAKVNSYKAPDWFNTASDDNSTPSDAKKSPRAFQPREPPFGTDNMSSWERDDSSTNGKEKNNNVPDSQMEKLQTSNKYLQTSKFRRVVHDKKPAPVDMSKLLSFGYADGDKPIANTDLSN